MKNTLFVPRKVDYKSESIAISRIPVLAEDGLEMNPPFQRDYVWELQDKIKLIDSIFHHRTLGTIAIGELNGSYVVVDGKQRITAILDYITGKFPYKGHYWNDLTSSDHRFFKTSNFGSLLTAKVKNMETLAEWFVELNYSGKSMTKEDLNKAMIFINKKY